MLPDTVTRFRKEFERLEEQFRRCAGRHGRLEHEWICAWDSDEEVRLSEEQWQKFAEVNSENHVDDTSGWSCWDGPWEVTPSQNLFGRFLNDPSGFEEFLKLAEMGGAFLRCLDSTILKAGSGYSTWLYHLHRVGLLYPCSYLEVRVSIWNAAEDDQRAESELHSLWKDYDGIVIPTFPKVHSFEFDLFTTSAALCRVILERKFVSFWGDLAEDIPLLPFSDQSPMDGHQLVAEADVDMSATGCKNQWIFKNGWHYVSFEEDQLSAIPIEAHKGAEHILRLIEAEGDDIPCFRFEVGSRKLVGGGVRLASHSNEQVEGAISSGAISVAASIESEQLDEESNQIWKDAIAAMNAEINEQERTGADTTEDRQKFEEMIRMFRSGFDAKGHPRRFRDPQIKSMYESVRAAVKSQIGRLRNHGLVQLANHLEDAIKWKAEKRCVSYDPSPATTWKTNRGVFECRRR